MLTWVTHFLFLAGKKFPHILLLRNVLMSLSFLKENFSCFGIFLMGFELRASLCQPFIVLDNFVRRSLELFAQDGDPPDLCPLSS
jgi:hypothetical protein